MNAKIALKKYGTYLSGRSLPVQIIQEADITNGRAVVIDFDAIESCNPSFINELLMQLHKRGADLQSLAFVNISSTLQARFQGERERILFEMKQQA